MVAITVVSVPPMKGVATAVALHVSVVRNRAAATHVVNHVWAPHKMGAVRQPAVPVARRHVARDVRTLPNPPDAVTARITVLQTARTLPNQVDAEAVHPVVQTIARIRRLRAVVEAVHPVVQMIAADHASGYATIIATICAKTHV